MINAIHTISTIGEESSGPSYSVPRLCKSLICHDINVALATIDWLPLVNPPEFLRTFSLGVGPKRVGRSPEMYRWLKSKVRTREVDIIHGHEMWQMNALYPGWVTKGQKAKLVFSPRGTLSSWAMNQGSSLKGMFWSLFQRPAIENTACFHATGEHEYDDIRRLGFRQPVAIIPNGIDIPIVEELGRSESGRVVLFLGRMHPVKGIDNLLKAWSVIQDIHPDWRLEIAGSDVTNGMSSGYLLELKTLARSLKTKRVFFMGELNGDQKFRAYRKADLYVLPSRSENFGVTIAESLASGTPVLTTTGTPWEKLNEKDCGWCIDLNDTKLSDSLGKAMELSQDRLRRMGKKGVDWMSDEYSWERIGKMTSSVYEWLLYGGNKPACVNIDC